MPLAISKDCFPDPSRCHNCMRKRTRESKKQTEEKKDYKRCAICHFMTYCDKDCQREHWIKIHKNHCRFLSGKDPVENSEHNEATCSRCIDQNEESHAQLRSPNSPKTICNIEAVKHHMKTELGESFDFHGEGKKCSCSVKYACQLPFPLGEVSGQYLERASTGVDAMLAHSLHILTTMILKATNEEKKKSIMKVYWSIIGGRSCLWGEILVCGMMANKNREYLLDEVNGIRSILGASNPFWKSLKFSIMFAVRTSLKLNSNLEDSTSLEDPRFKRLKLLYNYDQSQLENIAIVTEKQMWPTYMLWPQSINGSLAVVLPPGIQCQSCFTELSGEVAVSPQEVNSETLPYLRPDVSDDGAMMASCPPSKNSNCVRECFLKNVRNQMLCDEDEGKELEREWELFRIEARDCDFCFKSSLSSHRCSACLAVQYCSTICQKKDLKYHKSVCETWAKDKNRKICGKEKHKDHFRKSVFVKE